MTSDTEDMDYIERVEHYRSLLSEGYREHFDGLLDKNCSPLHALCAVRYLEGVDGEKEKFTQKELSKKHNVAAPTISKWYREIEDTQTNENKTNAELLEEIGDEFGWNKMERKGEDGEFRVRRTRSSITAEIRKSGFVELTGERSPIEQIKVLQSEYNLQPEDFMMSINLNKSGLLKILERAKSEDYD